MKRKKLKSAFAIIIISVVIFAGCANKDPLTGIWINEEDEIFVAFIDDVAFIGEYDGINYDIETITEFSYEKGSGTLKFYSAEFEMSLKNNVLTVFMYDPVEFVKIESEPASKEIAGVWRSPPWLLAFVNEKVFIVDRDGDADYADYEYDINTGYFETEYYGWEIEFAVEDDLMTTSIENVRRDFIRAR